MPTMPTPQMPTPRQPSVSQLPQGVKRPATEDSVENVQSSAPAAPMQATISQQRTSNGPGQRQQPGQQNSVATNGAIPQRPNIPQELLERKWQELLKQYENSANIPKRRPGPISPEVRQHLENLIKETAAFIPELDDCIRTFFMNTGNEQVTSGYLRMRLVLRENVNFQNFTLVQDLTIDPKALEKMIDQVRKVVASVSISFKKQNLRARQTAAQVGPTALQAQQQLPGSDAAATNQQMSTAPAQLNAVNLQQHNQQQAQRRPNIKPPAAPTIGPGQFQPFATSPQGVPRYEGPQKVSAADLKMPPKKKQKTGQTTAPSTTAQAPPVAAPAPQISKTGSPELLRKQAEVKVEAQKPVMAFKCSENGCGRAFQTQEELDGHKKDTHVVIEDCLSYALENLAESIGLNKDGTLKAPHADAQKPSTKMSAKQGSDALKKGAEQPAKAGTSIPADGKAGTTDKPADSADGADATAPMDVDDPWANSPLKPSEIADIFNPIASLISPTSVVDSFNPTREQLVKAGIIAADRPLTPAPSDEEVPDLSDPNTTPSPTYRDWKDDPWYADYKMPKWALQPVETWLPARPPSVVDDNETVFDDDPMLDLLPGSPVDLERPWIKRTMEPGEVKGREMDAKDVVSMPGQVWAKHGWVGPREGEEEKVVPVTEKQRVVREEERKKREKERERDEENRRKDPERLKKWQEDKAKEREKLRKKAEEIERLQYLKQKDVPGWENFDPFEEFLNA